MLIDEERDARKDVIKEDEAWDILMAAQKISVAKGKKIIEYTPSQDVKEDLLKSALGRTGNLKAPTIQVGRTLYVGFNETMYGNLMQ